MAVPGAEGDPYQYASRPVDVHAPVAHGPNGYVQSHRFTKYAK